MSYIVIKTWFKTNQLKNRYLSRLNIEFRTILMKQTDRLRDLHKVVGRNSLDLSGSVRYDMEGRTGPVTEMRLCDFSVYGRLGV